MRLVLPINAFLVGFPDGLDTLFHLGYFQSLPFYISYTLNRSLHVSLPTTFEVIFNKKKSNLY